MRTEANPDAKEPMSTPIEPTKNTDPTWPDVMAMSSEMVGMSGEKMKRPRKGRKNRRVKKTTFPTTRPLKGTGMGQVFSIYSMYQR